jgi:hypothetical protein
MKTLALILFAFLCLPVVVFAVPYNSTIGPYNVSFDMDSDDYYIIAGRPWTAFETVSGEQYEKGNFNVERNETRGYATIEIQHNNKERSHSCPANAVVWTIDGVSGCIQSIDLRSGVTIFEKNGVTTFYAARYHPAFDPMRLNVTIISTIPWDNGTLQLLKTIHVTEAKKMVLL